MYCILLYTYMVIRFGCKSEPTPSAAVLGSQPMAWTHSFYLGGESRLCTCPLCLAFVRIGQAFSQPEASAETSFQVLQQLQLLGGVTENLVRGDQVARGAAPPASRDTPVAPGRGAEGDYRRQKEKKSRGKEEESHRRVAHRDRRETGSRSAPSHCKASPSPEEKKEKKHPKAAKKSGSRSRRRGKRVEAPKVRETPTESPSPGTKKETTEPKLIPVKKEEESEGEESSSGDSDPPVEEPPKGPDSSRSEKRKPAPPDHPPPGHLKAGLPGAKYIPWPEHRPNDRPPLPRWQGVIPAGRNRPAEPPVPAPRTERKRRKEKGVKKKRRQKEIKDAGGIANWHATKKST